MLKRASSRSGLFLLELIISILFFSLASAVCIRLFVEAHIMDRDNRNLTQAVKLCENLAEVYTAADGDTDTLQKLYQAPFFERSVEIDLTRDISLLLHEWDVVSRVHRQNDSPRALYPVTDLLLLLDRDWQPTTIPQSDGYVLAVVSLSEHPSAGELRVASFGVWSYADLTLPAESEGAEAELSALTGNVTDDLFFAFSALSEEDAIYTLDVTVYVPERGGDAQ